MWDRIDFDCTVSQVFCSYSADFRWMERLQENKDIWEVRAKQDESDKLRSDNPDT